MLSKLCEIAAGDIGRSQRKADIIVINPVEIDQTLQHGLQRASIVKAGGSDGTFGRQPWRQQARLEKAGNAEEKRAQRAERIEQLVFGIIARQQGLEDRRV